jgi:polyferredoxin
MKIKKISLLRFLTQLTYLSLFITGIILHNRLMIFITISAILLGPIFCGWMCFVGLYQDICRYLGEFIKIKPLEVNKKFHGILKYSRYFIFIGSITLGGLFLFPGKVWGNFAGLLHGYIKINVAFYFLIALGIISLFTKRFFCRYLCTFGAKLGLFSLIRPITINREENSCNSCGLCSKECLMNIEVDKSKSLGSPNCINCLKCIEACPNKSLKIGFRNYLKP